MTSQVSKDAFAASLNLSAASGQTDSVITGSTTNFSADIGNALDLTNTLQILEKLSLRFLLMVELPFR